MFWKSKWERFVYAVIFFMTGFISLIVDLNAGNGAAFSTIVFLFIGSLNLVLFAFKAIRKRKVTSNLNHKLNSELYTTKWKNGLYGLFFLLIGVILYLKKETSSDFLGIQLALLFGATEAFIFIAKLLNFNKFKQMN